MKIIEILQHEEEGRPLSACPGRAGRWSRDGPGPTSGQRRVVRAGRQQRAPAHASPDRRLPGARRSPHPSRKNPPRPQRNPPRSQRSPRPLWDSTPIMRFFAQGALRAAGAAGGQIEFSARSLDLLLQVRGSAPNSTGKHSGSACDRGFSAEIASNRCR